jgi:hypothetical protein
LGSIVDCGGGAPTARAHPGARRSAAQGAGIGKNGTNDMSGKRRRPGRLARRLGLDANPMRRRTDRIGTWLAVQFLVVVLLGAPLLGIAAFSWAARAGTAERWAERSWHEVPAVLLRAAPVPDSFAGGVFGYSWVPARWQAPDGHVRSGDIPVEVGLTAGRMVPLWVDARGTPTEAPITHRAVLARSATAAVVAVAVLLILLSGLAWAGRRLLDRRRLADWELAWSIVGPQWTKRFRSRG